MHYLGHETGCAALRSNVGKTMPLIQTVNLPSEAVATEERAAGFVHYGSTPATWGPVNRTICVSECISVDSCNQTTLPEIKSMDFRAGNALKRSMRQWDWGPNRMCVTCSSWQNRTERNWVSWLPWLPFLQRKVLLPGRAPYVGGLRQVGTGGHQVWSRDRAKFGRASLTTWVLLPRGDPEYWEQQQVDEWPGWGRGRGVRGVGTKSRKRGSKSSEDIGKWLVHRKPNFCHIPAPAILSFLVSSGHNLP